MDNSSEKLFSAQDAITIIARFTGSKPQDLIDAINDTDLSTVDSLTSFLDPYYVTNRNAIKTKQDEKYDNGFRKGRTRAEEEFTEVFQVDAKGKKLSSLFMDIKQQLNSKKTKEGKTEITASQAFQNKEVKEAIANKDATIEKLTGVQTSFNTYKNLQGIKTNAMGILSEHGAIFSSDPARRIMQISAFESSLQGTNYKTNTDGSITILDVDGETPLHNSITGENWTFKEWVISKSPVDFGEQPTAKPNKDTFTPNDNNSSNGNNFGFTSNQLPKLSMDDFNFAKNAGETQKADFILKTMEATAEKEQNNSNK